MQLTLGLAPPLLRLAVLGSGSAGNALVIESDGRSLMVDAGFSCREIERRLRLVGLDRGDLDGILLTHEHGDHVRGVARFARRNGTRVYGTAGTLAACAFPDDVATAVLRVDLTQGVGAFEVEPFSVSHDASDPVGFVISDRSGRRVGIAADTGCRPAAWRRLSEVHVLVVETNHDLEMLRTGPYSWPLKQRVGGPLGHLSNRDAAEGVEEVASERLQSVVLYHLSRTNNLPALALEEIEAALSRVGSAAKVHLTSQHEPTGWLEIDGGMEARAAMGVGVAV